MNTQVQAIILAAGKSTRFNTGKTKLLEPICGQPMILYPVKLLESLSIPTTVVVGYQKDEMKRCIEEKVVAPVHFVEQVEQRGTGHAIVCTRDSWSHDYILILNGDTPLVSARIIEDLIKKQHETNAVISFITAHYSDAASSAYGRVIQSEKGIEIVEARNFTGDAATHCCINAGIYIVSRKFLDAYIDMIQRNELAQEFYFTDLIKIASDSGHMVSTLSVPFDCIRGINTFQELWATEQIQRAELIKYWMERGVRFSVPQNVHIDLNVTVGAGTFIGCGVYLGGSTVIGKNCTISGFNSLYNVSLGDNVTINSHCILTDSSIHDNVQIGPFAHVHHNSTIQSNSVIGNFVEVKNSTIGEYTKAKHLSYLGDTHIGKAVNIGAGTITCNYDGVQKHTTIIEDNVFIGSNNTLVAPLVIHKNSFTAAGSTITHNVPEDTLAFGRSRQINKEGYMYHKRMSTSEELVHNQDEAEMAQHEKSFIGATKTDVDTSNWYLD